MFRHALTLAYRSFLRFKGAFFINLVGLSTGLACSLLIYLWVKDELSVDKFHEKDSQMYQVMRTSANGDGVGTSGVTPGVVAQVLAGEMPEVEYAAAAGIYLPQRKTLSVGDKNIKAEGVHVGKDFFNIFSFPVSQGDARQLLNDPNAIVISDELALRLFGTTENLVGKMVQLQHEEQHPVTGVFEKIPPNSSIQFDFVMSHEGLVKDKPHLNNWNNNYTGTFLVLKEGTNVEQFNAKIAHLAEARSEVKTTTLSVRPFSDGYLYDKYENGVQVGGRIEYVKLFSLIAFFILLIACSNFMNLSTAKAARRMKEVGIKKAIGASRGSLLVQYLGESLLITLISVLIALVLVIILLPGFRQLTDKQIFLSADPAFLGALLGITIFTGLVAGSYPALYLSGFKPISILKGRLTTGTGEVWVRKGLVIFQFTLSVIFIVAVTVIYQQIRFIQNKNLGYNKDHIIYLEKEGRAAQNLDAFLSEAKSIPGVVDASSLLMNFIGAAGAINQLDWEGKNPQQVVEFEYRIVNHGFIEMMGIQMKEGRSFGREFNADNATIIFNEAAIKAMNLENPVGKTIKFMGKDRQIVGVVKDFYFESLTEKVRPLFFDLLPEVTGTIMIKLAAGKERESIDRLSEFYQRYNPGFVFDYKFLDADYQALYAAEQRVSILSRYFAGLAILISCLGLLGLAAFTAERRKKEISIRKILGSSETDIILLLTGEFTKLVLVAVLVALPVGYFFAHQWLAGFAYRINLTPWYFLLSGLLALLVTWFTVGTQALKAARINPVNSLKDD